MILATRGLQQLFLGNTNLKHLPQWLVNLVAVCAIATTLSPQNGYAQIGESCLSCHSDTSLTLTDVHGREQSAYIDTTVLAQSVHSFLSCTDCHSSITDIPHPEQLPRVDCASCHADEAAAFRAGIHGKALAANDPDAPTCTTCHGRHNIRAPDDSLSLISRINQPSTCGRCHGNEGFIQRHHLPSALPAAQYERSIHAKAVQRGVPNAPSCSGCHRAHEILPPSDPSSPISRLNVANTCGTCHAEIKQEYSGSIHGVALREGFSSAPTCNTCHGEHNIQSPTKADAATNPTRVSQLVCEPCHSSIVLNENFGLPASQVRSYFNSYHGLAVSRGSKVAANCTSCHGIHNIYAPGDPRSTVNPANMETTCGKCHPGAGVSFTQIPVHGQPSSREISIVAIIRDAYIVLIAVIIAGMFLHNLIIYGSYVVGKYKLQRVERTIRRFNWNMVIQHAVLFLSFTVLAITGFALKFPGVFHILGSFGIDEHSRSIIHRIAASTLVAGGLYHLYWLMFRRRGRIELKAMLPIAKDIWDARDSLLYYLRLSDRKPQYGQYSYTEKVEYWALIWGTVVMSLTGFALWFPVPATNLLGAWITPVATVIHFYEAILATAAIVIWHFFFTIFHPEEYPMSMVWITGKMGEEEARKDRPQWLEQIGGSDKPAATELDE